MGIVPDIKICGLTNLADANAALEAGADFLGFILYERSPRSIAPKVLRQIVEQLSGNPKIVGVFVNEAPGAIIKIANDCHLHAIQLHGNEEADAFKEMPVPLWRAVHIHNKLPVPDPQSWSAERYVLDAFAPDQYGGTGEITDWAIAARIARRFPVMLAGGLTAENVGAAIRTVQPTGAHVAI